MPFPRSDRGARTDRRQRSALAASEGVLRVTPVQTAEVGANYGEQVVMDTAGGALNCNLPTAWGCRDQCIGVKNIGALGNSVTIVPMAGETIDGAVSYPVNDGENIVVQSNGENWIIV